MSEKRSYDDSIKESCFPDPILEKVLAVEADQTISMTVRAYQSNYGKFIYWYVGCDVPYLQKPFEFHPFRFVELDHGETQIQELWGVVADNDLTRLILTYLTMSDDQLKAQSGNTNPCEYRAMLINMLELLWD